jgi:hypothetical protein
VITGLRWVGLTLAEIRDLAAEYLQHTDTPVGPRLAEVLQPVRTRTEERIAELQALLGCIDRFEAEASETLAGRGDLGAGEPRAAHRTA